MGISLKTVGKGLATVPVMFMGETATVTYRLAERTPVKDAGIGTESLVDFVVRVVDSWDIVGDDDKTPVPLKPKFVEAVPTPILRAVVRTVLGDNGLGEAPASSASG